MNMNTSLLSFRRPAVLAEPRWRRCRAPFCLSCLGPVSSTCLLISPFHVCLPLYHQRACFPCLLHKV